MAVDWGKDADAALAEAKKNGKLVLLDFSAAPACGACARLDAEVYPDQKVSEYIAQNFIPVKLHVKEAGAAWHRFAVQWPPTIMFLDGDGKEHFRFEGFLPAANFLAELDFGRGRAAFHRKQWDQAASLFNSAAARDRETELAAEAGYWAAAAQYQKTHDSSALRSWGKKIAAEYPHTTWARRALVYTSEGTAKA
jgi:thioredoxin-related protein